MEHHTTLNLELSLRQKLITLAEAQDISVNKTIVILMKLLSCEIKHRKIPERLVEYQKLSENEEWCTCHLYLSFSEYQHFSDMRNFFKMSVSFLVAYAVKKYGHQLLNNLSPENWDDKNLFPHHSIGKPRVLEQQFFVICWGKTTEYP